MDINNTLNHVASSGEMLLISNSISLFDEICDKIHLI